jgi:glycerol uptake facilitator-like aquaporin
MRRGRCSRVPGWGPKLVALMLILTLAPGCPFNPAQIVIPLAYAMTGLCIALLVSPTLTAAVIGLVVGGILGAAVYNNSLKQEIHDKHSQPPAPAK